MRHSLAFKLPALVVVGVLLSTATGTTLALVTGRDLLRNQAIEATSRKLDGYLNGVEQFLDRARELLVLTAVPATAGGAGLEGHAVEDNQARADRLLVTSSVFEYVMLLDANGRPQVLRPAAFERQQGKDSLAQHEWFMQAAAGEAAVGDLEVSLATRRPTVVVAQPLRDTRGQVVGVWAGGLKLAGLSGLNVTPGGKRAREAHGLVTDTHGLIVAHQGNPAFVQSQTDFSTVPSVKQSLAGRSGEGFFRNPIERREKVAAWAPLPDIGWAVEFSSPADVALSPFDTMTTRLAWAGLVGGLVFAAASALLVARALRPLRQLRVAAVLLGTGDLDTRIAVGTRDEVGLLGEEFNRMAASLAAKHESLTEHASRLEQAVEQLRAAIAQRDLTVAELDAFCYSVSHDLRAPLRAIAGFSAAVITSESEQLSDRGRTDLERVRRATERMGRIIDDLLSLSRLSQVSLKGETIDLTSMAHQICAELSSRDPGRAITWDIAEGLTASGDRGLIRILLEQLLGNAWKFTAQVPTAHIEVGRDQEGRFFVRDNGAGFDPRYAHKLFGAFQRLHTEAEFEGNGIGLATARRIVTRHGGTVGAAGQPGAGATFTFTLGGGSTP